MTCPNCGALWPESDRFCSDCGCPLHPEVAPVPVKKGSHVVPLIIMIIMAILGTIVYFAIRLQDGGPDASVEAPWFAMEGNVLVDFDPQAYTGSSDLVIPATIDGTPVLSIGPGCFQNCTGLSSITLPEGVIIIGESAFSGCTDLRGMYIPSSVEEVGRMAFYQCSSLEAICLNADIRTIGADAFDECSALVYILYTGKIDQWHGLYNEYINPFTHIFCSEGTFPQGGAPAH